MEQEYKWILPADISFADAAAMPIIAENCINTEKIKMLASYYDTEDSLFRQMHGSLRLRKENEKSVCCMKLSLPTKDAAFALRREYEVEAQTLAEGIHLLPDCGDSPQESEQIKQICGKISSSDLIEICCTDYTRMAYTLQITADTGKCTAELAMDSGLFRNGNKSKAFAELELEYKSGETAAFHAYAKQLADTLSLTPQPLSKMARAVALKFDETEENT